MKTTRQFEEKYVPYKTYEGPGNSKKFHPEDELHFHHEISVMTKPTKNGKVRTKNFFCKLVTNELEAQVETVAQEFLRFMRPDVQPKTRWWKKANNTIYVLSEAVDGFEDLFNAYKTHHFKTRIFESNADLAELLVSYLFLNNFDVRDSNLAFNRQNRIIGIDGEQCLAELQNLKVRNSNSCHQFSSKDLTTLCHPSTYRPRNWPFFSWGSELENNPRFQQAINETILKIILLPDHFFYTFVNCYATSQYATRIADALIMRKNNLLTIALHENQRVKQYIQSPKAVNDLTIFLKKITLFKTMGKQHLLSLLPNLSVQMHLKLIKFNSPLDFIPHCLQLLLEENPPDIEAIKTTILSSEIDFSLKNQLEQTFLEVVIEKGLEEIIWLFLKNSFLLDQLDADDLARCLYHLAKYRQWDCVKYLLEQKPQIHAYLDEQYYSALHFALLEATPDLELISNLYNLTAETNQQYYCNVFATAFKNNHHNVLVYFFLYTDFLNQVTKEILGAFLIELLKKQYYELIEIVLSKQPCLRITDPLTGNNALHLALLEEKSDMSLIEKLCAAQWGIDFTQENKKGETPLLLASRQPSPQILNFLLVHLPEPSHAKLLHHVIRGGQFQLAHLLLNKYPNIDVLYTDNRYAEKRTLDLLIANEKSDLALIMRVCGNIAILGQKNVITTRSELTIAVKNKRYNIVEFLLTHGGQQYSWQEMKDAIWLFLQEKNNPLRDSIFKINLLNYIRIFASGNESERRETGKKFVISVLDQTQNSEEVLAVINRLIEMENQAAFLRPRRGYLAFLAKSRFQGMDISRTFLELIDHAKRKLHAFSDGSSQVQSFLNMPTTG